MKQSCASCKHALFKGNDHYGKCTIHWCLDGSAHPMISKDWTCGSDCKDYYCYEKLAAIVSAHAAEVDRLTDECDAAVRERDAAVEALRGLVSSVDALVSDSYGVTGLHLNGDVAPWEELLQGGRYEEWLMQLEVARSALVKIEGERNG